MEMDDANKSKLLNFFIPVGVLIFGLGALVSFMNSTPKTIFVVSTILLLIQILLGLLIVIIACKKTKKATHLFIGLTLFVWGLLHGILNLAQGVQLKQWWPVYGATAGIILFISGFFRYRKMKIRYAFPAIVLFIMGVWYSLFSFKIITKSFSSVVATLGPFFVLALVLSLVIFFLLQQKHKELVLPEDETGTFSDEEE